MWHFPLPTTKEETGQYYGFLLENDEENQNIDSYDDSNDLFKNFFDRYKENSISYFDFIKENENKSENKENKQELEYNEQKNNVKVKKDNKLENENKNAEEIGKEYENKVEQNNQEGISNKEEQKEFKLEKNDEVNMKKNKNEKMLLAKEIEKIHENINYYKNEGENGEIQDTENYQIQKNIQIHEDEHKGNVQEKVQMSDKINKGINRQECPIDIDFKYNNSNNFELPKNDGNVQEENREKEKIVQKEKEPHKMIKKRKQKNNDKYRLDDFLKIILTVCFNYILSELRAKIKKCKNIYNKKSILHLTNYKKYQGNPAKANIRKIFQQSVKNAFCDFFQKCFEGTTRQRDNKTFIDQIYEREDFPLNEEEIELKKYLEMKIIDLIKKFYDDEPEELINLRERYQNWDELFFKEKKKKKGFYLLQNYGIIQYAQMTEPLFKKLVDEGRYLINECNFKDYKEFDGIKLLFVSPKKYPKNRDVRNNPILLQKKVKDILIGEKDENLKKNKKIIEIFYYLINEKNLALTKEQANLKLFLEMSIQEYINNNYNDSDIINL